LAVDGSIMLAIIKANTMRIAINVFISSSLDSPLNE
jgi:hypothetical protein